MSSEPPADRLHHRPRGLGAAGGEGGAEDPSDESSETSLSRWLPASPPTGPAAQVSAWASAIRADPGRAGVLALGVVGALAVLVTVVTLLRDSPPAVVSARLPPVENIAQAAATPGSPAPAEPVVVSVVGLVGTPGLVRLDPGARIADAIAAAGGALDGADVLGLNMARRVADGEQIVVGIEAPPGAPPVMGSSVASGADPSSASSNPHKGSQTTGPVDLNTATVEQLDTLPGIGPVTAAAIIAWRDTNGRFDSVDQLGDVDGIGPARLEALREVVRV